MSESFYLTFPSDTWSCWIRIEAPTYDDARVWAVRNYGTNWARLAREDDFNADLHPGGELRAVHVEPVR